MVNIRSTTKQFISFMFMVLSTGVIGCCKNGWIGNRNINGKRDHHRESGARCGERLNWNMGFANDIIIPLLKGSFGFLTFKLKVCLDFGTYDHAFKCICMELILIFGNQKVEHKKLLHQYS